MKTRAVAPLPEGWERREVVADGQPVPILVRRAGAAEGAATIDVVAARPLLSRDTAGQPRLAATLLLCRQPSTADPNIEPLIESGVVGFTVTLALPEDVVAGAIPDPSLTARPLFARTAAFALRRGEVILQRVDASGPDASAAFSLSVDRETTLDVLAAIGGDPSPLDLTCRLEYRTADPASTLRLSGNWALLHDALAVGSPPGADTALDRDQLAERLTRAVEAGALRIEPDLPDPDRLMEALLRVAGPLLDARSEGGVTLYRLRPRLNPAMQLDATFQLAGDVNRTLDLSAPLSEILGGCLDGLETERYVRLVAPDRTGLPAPVPQRVRAPGFRGPLPPATVGRASLARLGDTATSLTAATHPTASSAVSAHVLLANTTVQPQPVAGSAAAHLWTLDDLTIVASAGAGAPAVRSLPVVEDPGRALWSDRSDPAKRWYAPAFSIESPAPNASPATSPFLFEFRTSGHTTSGQPGLEGSVSLRLRSGMSDATRTAWEAAGKPNAAPVTAGGLSVSLSVPFRDQAGATRTQAFPANVTVDGDVVTARVELIDDWLRLAYGALAVAGFQASPAQVRVAYTFDAYVPLTEGNLELLFDRKFAMTMVKPRDTAGAGRADRPYLDASMLTYRTPNGSIGFSPEAPASRSAANTRRPSSAALGLSLGAASAAEMRAGSRARAGVSLFAIRPQLEASVDLGALIKERKYGVQTIGRDQALDALFPCETLGGFYVQATDEGNVAIGCRESFQLGQTTFRAYARIDDPALASPDYSVWRSLQQPGRFLLVPARYAVVRFGADDPDRAYRPAIFLYSTVDADHPENNRCAVLASMAPDVSRFATRALERKLTTLAETPVVSLINEIEATVEYEWPLPSSGNLAVAEFRATKLHDGFQLSISCEIDAAPELQTLLQTSGVVGTARFTLPDGTKIETALAVDLNRIVGPAPDGPVASLVADGHCTLTNKVERAVDVHDLTVETETGAAETVPVDRRLGPGESADVPVTEAAKAAFVDATPAPGDAATLTEIRSFVEDVHTNVAFLNLTNYANHAIAALSLQARLRGVTGTQTITVDENVPVSTLEFVLPLTTYLADPTVEFAVTRSMTDGTSSTTPWVPWPLATQGNVISLTWAVVQ